MLTAYGGGGGGTRRLDLRSGTQAGLYVSCASLLMIMFSLVNTATKQLHTNTMTCRQNKDWQLVYVIALLFSSLKQRDRFSFSLSLSPSPQPIILANVSFLSDTHTGFRLDRHQYEPRLHSSSSSLPEWIHRGRRTV